VANTSFIALFSSVERPISFVLVMSRRNSLQYCSDSLLPGTLLLPRIDFTYLAVASHILHRRMGKLTRDASESLDARIESEDLDGRMKAVEVREALEQVQSTSLEVSEKLDAYQNRHGP
jgi:hypothetical protein